jgi:hypothetical protein
LTASSAFAGKMSRQLYGVVQDAKNVDGRAVEATDTR